MKCCSVVTGGGIQSLLNKRACSILHLLVCELFFSAPLPLKGSASPVPCCSSPRDTHLPEDGSPLAALMKWELSQF